jgi:hypothetical protein
LPEQAKCFQHLQIACRLQFWSTLSQLPIHHIINAHFQYTV